MNSRGELAGAGTVFNGVEFDMGLGVGNIDEMSGSDAGKRDGVTPDDATKLGGEDVAIGSICFLSMAVWERSGAAGVAAGMEDVEFAGGIIGDGTLLLDCVDFPASRLGTALRGTNGISAGKLVVNAGSPAVVRSSSVNSRRTALEDEKGAFDVADRDGRLTEPVDLPANEGGSFSISFGLGRSDADGDPSRVADWPK